MAEKTDEEIIKEVGLDRSNDITPEEALEELSLDNNLEESLEPIIEEITTTDSSSTDDELKTKKNDSEDNDSQKNNKKDMNREDIEESIPVQKKQPKIYKILMGIVAFLVLILFVGVALYFLGFFDPEEIKKMPDKKTEIKKIEPEIEFNSKDLNKKRLNKKLTMLTKHEIMNRGELEAEEKRIKEEEKKKKDDEEKALADKKRIAEEKIATQYEKIEKEKQILINQQKAIKQEQENFLRRQEEASIKLEEKRVELLKELEKQRNIPKVMPEPEIEHIDDEVVIEEEKEEVVKDKISNTFSSFINVATIKGELYKEFLDEVQKYDKNISLCRDAKNRIEILFGPYDSNKERKKVFDNLLNNGFKESYLIDFTIEEYEKRCKY